jgi:hypothetical protein
MTDLKHYLKQIETEKYKRWEATRATSFKPKSLNILETFAISGHPKAVEVMKLLNPDWQPPKESKS